ncbi:MAG: SP family xylose:H+ symportor-like MFS transporter [Flavobacteriales bacterium]|jgi:SP family xylose:H+ symportor-like MFS transporter
MALTLTADVSEKPEAARFNVLVVTLVATLGGLLFGYDTAVISGAVASIEHVFVLPWGLSETARDSLTGFAVASALIGCIVGGGLAGVCSARFGRKRSLFIAAVLFLVSAIGSAVPELFYLPFTEASYGEASSDWIYPFVAFRILGGLGVGLASMVSPMYIAEIAPANIRGRLVSYNQIAIVGGMVVVYFVNWAIASQGDSAWLHTLGWRWMFASECIPAAVFFALLFLVPESPRWLVLQGRHQEAEAVLKKFNAPDAVASTLSEIKGSMHHKHTALFSFGGMLIVVGVLLSVFQQFIGINVVLYYAPEIFRTMGASNNAALLQTILVGVVNVGFTVVAIMTVDKYGRKPLMLIGASLMSLSMFTLGSLFYFEVSGLIAIVVMSVYMAAFALSWGPVTWVLLSEIFPNSIKSKAMAIAVAVQWIANWLVSWSFKVIDGDAGLIESFHHGFAYWLYGFMGLLAAAFVYFWVPETKGKSLEEIESMWHKN